MTPFQPLTTEGYAAAMKARAEKERRRHKRLRSLRTLVIVVGIWLAMTLGVPYNDGALVSEVTMRVVGVIGLALIAFGSGMSLAWSSPPPSEDDGPG